MRRVRFSVAVSLDGCIAGPNGEFDWILMDPDIDFGALMGAFDTVLLGRKTYEMTRQQAGSGMPGMQVYVFSRTLRQEDCSGVTVSSTLKETVAGWGSSGIPPPSRTGITASSTESTSHAHQAQVRETPRLS